MLRRNIRPMRLSRPCGASGDKVLDLPVGVRLRTMSKTNGCGSKTRGYMSVRGHWGGFFASRRMTERRRRVGAGLAESKLGSPDDASKANHLSRDDYTTTDAILELTSRRLSRDHFPMS